MKIKVIFVVLMTLFTNFVGADQTATFSEDRSFVMAGPEFWQSEVLEHEVQTTSDFIQKSQELYEKYQKEGVPFSQFAHSEQGLKGLFFYFEEILKVYKIAEAHTKSFDEFFDLMDRQFITLRVAVMSSDDYQTLHDKILRAVEQVKEDILSNGDANGTAAELQFVYLFVYNFEERLSKEEESKPVSSGKEFAELAKNIFADMKDKESAPSDRSMETAVFAVEKIVDIFVASAHCATDLDEYGKLINTHVEGVHKGIEQGLVQDKSLEAVKTKAGAAAEQALKIINQCGRSEL